MILNTESLHVLKEQAKQAQEAEVREAVSGSIDEHLQAMKNDEYRKELQQGVKTALQLAQDLSQSMGNDWLEEQSSLLEGAGQLDGRAILDVADELQSRAGSLPTMNSILLETASESNDRRADAVFTGMKKVLGQTSATFREKLNLQKTPKEKAPDLPLPALPVMSGVQGLATRVVGTTDCFKGGVEEKDVPWYCKFYARMALPAVGFRYRNEKGFGVHIIPFNNWRHTAFNSKQFKGATGMDQFWTFAEIRLLTPYMQISIWPGVDAKVDIDKVTYVGLQTNFDVYSIRNPGKKAPSRPGIGPWEFYANILGVGIGLMPTPTIHEEVTLWWELWDIAYFVSISQYISRFHDNGCGVVKYTPWWYLYPKTYQTGSPAGINTFQVLWYPPEAKCEKFVMLQEVGQVLMLGAATTWAFAAPLK